ncbi:MAG TPA: ester cyclase [Thermoplasmata archaeon]|jgi:predicted ester cyclase
MSVEKNIAAFRRIVEEAFSQGKLNVLDEVCAPGMREHQSGIHPPNVDGIKGAITTLRTAFPDLRLTIEDVVASGEQVWVRLRCRGTHGGPLMEIPPTGKAFETTAIEVGRFQNGRLVEHWGVPDRLGMLEQLGIAQMPGRRA